MTSYNTLDATRCAEAIQTAASNLFSVGFIARIIRLYATFEHTKPRPGREVDRRRTMVT